MRKDDLPELEGLDDLEELPEIEELEPAVEFHELEELEPLEPPEELEPLEPAPPRAAPAPAPPKSAPSSAPSSPPSSPAKSPPKPAPAPAHAIEPLEPRGHAPAELAELPADEVAALEAHRHEPLPEAAPEAAASGAAAAPRELEKAPMMLQKAAALLTLAALLPWLVPAVDGAFPLERTLAKLLILLGGWLFYNGVKLRHGESIPGPLAAVGRSHKFALTTLAGVVMLIGISPLIDGGGMRAVVAKSAVAVGAIVWCQVQDYAKGGRFNPMLGMVIPMFGLGGLGRLVTVFGQFDALALVGSLGVTVAGALAGYTMVVAMKEAKEHGKRKKQAAMEARKRERAKGNR